MRNISMTELTIASAKNFYKKGSFINEDILVFDDTSQVPLPKEPRRVQCILVALCLEGTAQYTVDTEKHTVGPNDIIIIGDGQVTEDFEQSDDCRGIALLISKDFFHEIIGGIHELSSLFIFSRNHPVCPLLPQEVDTIIDYFQLLQKKIADQQHHFRRDTVRMLITTMVYDLSNIIYRMQQGSSPRQLRAEAIFTDFIALVEAHFRKERRVGWYAQQLCITPKYLSEIVKLVSHLSPNDWIDNYVTLEIKLQLKNSNKSIKEISHEMNFPNQSFFGKFFKEHVGMSPSAYRLS